jgi:hypothetical protein
MGDREGHPPSEARMAAMFRLAAEIPIPFFLIYWGWAQPPQAGGATSLPGIGTSIIVCI